MEKWSQDLSVNEAYIRAIRAVRTNNMSKLEELSKQKDVQTSALVYGIKNNHIDIIKTIIDLHADINHCDKDGRSLLSIASSEKVNESDPKDTWS